MYAIDSMQQPSNPYAHLFAQEVKTLSIPVVLTPSPPLPSAYEHSLPSHITPRDILVHTIRSWLEIHDSFFFTFNSLQSINESINSFIDIIITVLFNYNMPNCMVFPVVMYANKYVRAQGIKHDQLFHLLLASTMTTIKFWDDTASGVNKVIASTFNYSLQSVNHVERNFLKGIGWDLTLHWEEVELFALQISEYLNSLQSRPPLIYLHTNQNSYISSTPGVYCYVTN